MAVVGGTGHGHTATSAMVVPISTVIAIVPMVTIAVSPVIVPAIVRAPIVVTTVIAIAAVVVITGTSLPLEVEGVSLASPFGILDSDDGYTALSWVLDQGHLPSSVNALETKVAWTLWHDAVALKPAELGRLSFQRMNPCTVASHLDFCSRVDIHLDSALAMLTISVTAHNCTHRVLGKGRHSRGHSRTK